MNVQSFFLPTCSSTKPLVRTRLSLIEMHLPLRRLNAMVDAPALQLPSWASADRPFGVGAVHPSIQLPSVCKYRIDILSALTGY